MVAGSVATLRRRTIGIACLGLTGVIADFSGGGVESVSASAVSSRRHKLGLTGVIADFGGGVEESVSTAGEQSASQS